MLFTPYRIGELNVNNRFVCSATQDSELLIGTDVQEQTLEKYARLAKENVGLIISGGIPVVDEHLLETSIYDYEKIEINGLNRVADCVHQAKENAKIIAQLSTDAIYYIPSAYVSPWGMVGMHICERDEILFIEKCFIETALKMKEEGFDGIQLHGAHGGFLSQFLSPYANHRTDDYGGNTENRCRIVTDIIKGIKAKAPNYTVIIKINATEYFEDGMNHQTLQESVVLLEEAGVDAIEFSGGMWEAMMLSDEELGFPAVPSLESHTKIKDISRQSYFRKYVEDLSVEVPVILVGGNRNYDVIEGFLRDGIADFAAICRPLICEPDLISKWQEDAGYEPSCISCNACIYDMFLHPGYEEPYKVHCLYQMSQVSEIWRKRFEDGLLWIKHWKEENI